MFDLDFGGFVARLTWKHNFVGSIGIVHANSLVRSLFTSSGNEVFDPWVPGQAREHAMGHRHHREGLVAESFDGSRWFDPDMLHNFFLVMLGDLAFWRGRYKEPRVESARRSERRDETCDFGHLREIKA